MRDFEPMANFIPEGSKGVASITHFSISEKESSLTTIRAALHPEEYVPPGTYARLHVGRTLMMTDTLMEQNSNTRVVRNAKGDVLIAGLGVGMIVVPILRKPEVTSVTVVEKYQDVIDLVEPPLRKAVAEAHKLRVVCADIMTWSPPKGQKWDTIYFDIWPDVCTDNLEEMSTLHRKYARRKVSRESFMDSWMRTRLQMQKDREKRSGW